MNTGLRGLDGVNRQYPEGNIRGGPARTPSRVGEEVGQRRYDGLGWDASAQLWLNQAEPNAGCPCVRSYGSLTSADSLEFWVHRPLADPPRAFPPTRPAISAAKSRWELLDPAVVAWTIWAVHDSVKTRGTDERDSSSKADSTPKEASVLPPGVGIRGSPILISSFVQGINRGLRVDMA